jgi:hypothetical protein
MVDVGVPSWTEGHFTRLNALDDLGLESVGAGLLRRLLPGIVQTTPNAGYYAFYPYLLHAWEQMGGGVERRAFQEFYRRQEAAYALACLTHNHRGPLGGIQGSIRAGAALADEHDTVNVKRLSEDYMASRLGGYGLFYARVLSDMRLTRLGQRNYVDRVTPTGKAVAEAFARSFESTLYYTAYRDSEIVPLEVLAELGEKTCLCTIPARPDHAELLECFFAPIPDDPVWDTRRRTRVESIALILEYHQQRPAAVDDSLHAFRTCLMQLSYRDGTPFRPTFPERQQSWRAYQVRETETVLLTTAWSRYLRRLGEVGPLPHIALVKDLLSGADWAAWGLTAETPISTAILAAGELFPSGAALVDTAGNLASEQEDDVRGSLPLLLMALLATAEAAASDESGFAELRDEGGDWRWSLAWLGRWFAHRRQQSVKAVLADLEHELYHQHMRVATNKLSPTDHRDPFCISEEDGVLRLLRDDEPFWTGARYEVLNHWLWTLDLLDSPLEGCRPTELGGQILDQIRNDA